MSENSLEAVESASEQVVDVKETEQAETNVEAKEEAVAKEGTQEEKPELSEVERVKQSMQKRIDRKTAAYKDLQRKIQELEAQMPKQAVVDDSPKEEDFDSWEDYQEAVVKHKAEKLVSERLREEKQKELDAARQAQTEQARKQFEALEHDFRAEHADYDERASAFSETVADLRQRFGQSPTMSALGELIATSEVAPALVYELGGNLDLAEDLVSMSPVQAARELLKLEISLSKSPETKEEAPLPEPITPVKARGNASKNLNNMSAEELVRWAEGKH